MKLQEAITVVLPWVLSASTLWMKISTGNKSKTAWLHGLINQVVWFAWIFATATWGLLPMTVGLTIIYIRNHFKWNKPQAPDAADRDTIRGM